ncbi:MAG: hypothetical protein VW397_08700 [Candidatus Margulisiibacteriota bacterium]
MDKISSINSGMQDRGMVRINRGIQDLKGPFSGFGKTTPNIKHFNFSELKMVPGEELKDMYLMHDKNPNNKQVNFKELKTAPTKEMKMGVNSKELKDEYRMHEMCSTTTIPHMETRGSIIASNIDRKHFDTVWRTPELQSETRGSRIARNIDGKYFDTVWRTPELKSLTDSVSQLGELNTNLGPKLKIKM